MENFEIFEKTYFSAKSARAITESAALTGGAAATSQHRDISGCYYGKALDANPNDPFYFSTTDKAMLAFVKRQTPFRERHPNPDIVRDHWMHQRTPDEAPAYKRISPDFKPPPLTTSRSMSPFARQSREEKQNYKEARETAERQEIMKREMEEAQMKAIKEEWANDPERREVITSPLASYKPKQRPRSQSPERKFTKERTTTRPKPRGYLMWSAYGGGLVWVEYGAKGPKDAAYDLRGEALEEEKKAEEGKPKAAPMTLSERLAKKKERERAKRKDEGLVDIQSPRAGSPFKPRVRDKEDKEKEAGKSDFDVDAPKWGGHRSYRRPADDPANGMVQTPLQEAQEHCAFRKIMTPKTNKMSSKMGMQHISPFEDPEPMRLFREKMSSPAPSMTGWVVRNEQ
jgi:hypothetical protein